MKPDPLSALGTHVARREDELLAAEPASDATRQLLADRARTRGRARAGATYKAWLRGWFAAPSRLVLVLVASSALVALGFFVARQSWFGASALTFTVGADARQGKVQTWESAPPDADLPITFSDGSSVVLAPHAQARIAAVGSNGADITIESGGARFDVVPHGTGHARWSVRMGPFLVLVKGTRFDVAWQPRADELSLQLFEGKVVVLGCSLGEGRVLNAGERLLASCERQESSVSRGAGPTSIPAPTTPEVSAPTAGVVEEPRIEPEPRRALARPSGKGQRHWRELAERGDFRAAYELVSSSGFDREVERVGASDLLLLAGAARLSGHADQARAAYVAARRRFAGSDAAARAAFSLGRLAFDEDPHLASTWFETYLVEAPEGPLSQAALDRLLEAALRLGNTTRSRSIAQLYLKRSPAGPHAREAHEVLERAGSRE